MTVVLLPVPWLSASCRLQNLGLMTTAGSISWAYAYILQQCIYVYTCTVKIYALSGMILFSGSGNAESAQVLVLHVC